MLSSNCSQELNMIIQEMGFEEGAADLKEIKEEESQNDSNSKSHSLDHDFKK